MTAADKLAELLEEKDRELVELRQSVEEDRDSERWRWARPSDLPKEQGLPVPRLEIWLDPDWSDDYSRTWVYRMIYRHFLGHCVAVPLGCTKQCGGGKERDLKGFIPFRDGAHMNHDAKQFGWPQFIVKGDEFEFIPNRSVEGQ